MKFRHLAMLWFVLLSVSLNPAFAQSQSPLEYEIDFSKAVHHQARVTITATSLPNRPITFWMSRSSPGRYALHEFAKNVYSVVALDGTGDTLDISRPNPYSWKVPGHDGVIRLSYTLYADHADGTYSGIDETHAHLNMPATFMWIMSQQQRPLEVHFEPPRGAGWKVATQLQPTNDPMIYRAPNLSYFMDSPTELSDFEMRSWKIDSGRRTETLRLAMHTTQSSKQSLDRYTEMAKKVVREHMAVYGALPEYDYGTYTFIACYLPWVYGDGMEHRNSTILTSSQPLEGHLMDHLGTLSHEFIHGWNMERIRSAAIQPFDFTRANMSKELWFGEGFTSYYDDLAIRRAGLKTDSAYAAGISGPVNYVINAPGRKFFTPVQMSMQAPFVDAATSIDDQYKENTFISYYTWGSVLGLGLDLKLRSEFNGITLDDYMRAMWERYGKTGQPYNMDDLQNTLGNVTGNPDFARRFFDKYVRGHQVLPYDKLLAQAGMALVPAHPHQAFLGYGQRILAFSSEGATLQSNSIIGTPLYKTGLDHRDLILAIDGTTPDSPQTWYQIIKNHDPGDVVTIRYRSRGKVYEKDITFTEDPDLRVELFENLGRQLTAGMKQFRKDWLGSHAE